MKKGGVLPFIRQNNMLEFLKHLGIMVVNFCLSFAIAFGFLKFMTKDLSRTGTGAMGVMFGHLFLGLLSTHS